MSGKLLGRLSKIAFVALLAATLLLANASFGVDSALASSCTAWAELPICFGPLPQPEPGCSYGFMVFQEKCFYRTCCSIPE